MSEAARKPALSVPLPLAGPVLVSLWGVVGDGTADDTAALNAAAQYAGAHPGLDLIVPTLCRTTGTWVIPGGASVSGPGGVIADPGVAVAVAMGEASDFKHSFARRLTVARSGSPAAGCVGLAIAGGANVVIEDPIVYNHDIGVRFSGTDAPGASGFIGHIVRGVIGGFQSYAIEIDGWPVLRIAGTYFGAGGVLQEGARDFDARAIFHITGGNPAASGGGPNTVFVSDCEIDLFVNADGTQAGCDALWAFDNLSPGQVGEEGIYQWMGGHVENVRALARADATAAVIDGLRHLHSTWSSIASDQGVTWFGEDFAAGELRRCRVIDVDHWSGNMVPAKLLDLDGVLLSDIVLDTINTYQMPQQGSPRSISINAPAGSYGRISTDLPPAAVNITGPGAGGIVVG